MPKAHLLSQRSLQDAPIFRLLLKVAVKGTHQCDFFNFWGSLGLPTRPYASVGARVRACVCVCVCVLARARASVRQCTFASTRARARMARLHARTACVRMRGKFFNIQLTLQYKQYRSHFGSRYKLGCCGHAGLLRLTPNQDAT